MSKRIVSVAEAQRGPWAYRCLLNPTAPLLVVDSLQEHKEMQRNMEWEWIGADGNPLTTQEQVDREEAEQRIPLR